MSTAAGDLKINCTERDRARMIAVEAMAKISKHGKTMLVARGNAIPNAVGVANIVTKMLMKGKAKIEAVKVDSIEPEGMGRMISTIEITLART